MRRLSIASFHGKLILSATILASGFVFLFGAAISVALPAIQADLDAPLSGIQWIVNAYTLVSGVFILLSGAASDRFGRKRVFLFGAAIFITGLLLSGFASSMYMLIGFQTLIGMGAGMMVPVSLAIVHACFTEHEQGRAIGLWVGLAAVFGAAGPFVGGLLVDLFGWRAVFFSLVPIALLVMAVVWRFVPETKARNPGALDVWGGMLLGLGMFGVLFALIQGPTLGWGHEAVLGGMVVSVLALATLVYVEHRVKNPIIPPALFRNSRVFGANVATIFLYFVLGGTLFFLTLNFQQVQGMSAALTGAALLPPVALIALFSGRTGRLVDMVGARWPMVGGPLIVALGIALMIPAGSSANYFTSFFPGLVLMGVGMVIVIPALTVSAMSVADSYTGAASGVNNAASRTSWLFAIAALGVVAQFVFSGALHSRLEAASLPAALTQEILLQQDRFSGIEISERFGPETTAHAEAIIDESFVRSFRAVLAVNFVLALFASLVSVFYIRSAKRISN